MEQLYRFLFFYPKYLDRHTCPNSVWSAYILFAHHLAVLNTATGSQMGLLKRLDKNKDVKVFEYLG